MALPRALPWRALSATVRVRCWPARPPHRQPATPATPRRWPPRPSPAAPPAPAAPACGDGPALLASMSTRDKLAQLLMVGVTGAADARAVVDTHHVGGIMIGSWTDLSMLSDGPLADIAASAGPLPLAVSVDEEGGRVSRLSAVIGASRRRGYWRRPRHPPRSTTSRCSAARPCGTWASPSTSHRSST